MKKLLSYIFGDPMAVMLKHLYVEIEHINALESKYVAMSSEDLFAQTEIFKRRLAMGETVEDVAYDAFAVVRAMAIRVLGQRHFDVQLIGGLTLLRGNIAEMRTGEGKTLTSTLATYTSALEGKGVHVVTPNDYLAKRDAVWMGQLFHALGLSVGCIQAQGESFLYDPDFRAEELVDAVVADEGSKRDVARDMTASFKVEMSYVRPCTRQEAYRADITYGTNNEFGFDYLRDNMVMDTSEMVQRPLYHAIVDEIDSILIDEARTPLIISAPAQEATDQYYQFADLVRTLVSGVDYTVDEKQRTAILTGDGIERFEQALGVSNLYTEAGMRTVHHIENALKAHSLFKRDKDYVVADGEIIIVDEFTGRLMYGRRFSEGLHQAIEAKEGVTIQRESETLATITFQNYFRMYHKLSGMTGTAETEAEEFGNIYGLDVLSIPTNKPVRRVDHVDRIYVSEQGKFDAVIRDIADRQQKGQPMLVGTASIEKNELFSALLTRAGIAHELLNAKNHEREAQIIAQAGLPGAVTVATNMAGRGVDIVLGGNPPTEDAAARVREAGGLAVIGTERHESRRIDNQLRGRSGRQGDPGESIFYISVEDDLMRIFGSDRLKSVMKTLKMPEDVPIENTIVAKSLETAQKKVETHNYDIRKHLLEYDDVLNRHRQAVYARRFEILTLADSDDPADWERLNALAIATMESEFVRLVRQYMFETDDGEVDVRGLVDALRLVMPLPDNLEASIAMHVTDDHDETKRKESCDAVVHILMELAQKQYAFLREHIGEPANIAEVEKNAMVRAIDSLWVEHLVAMRYLRNSVGLQGYGQRDPLVEYKKMAFIMYHDLMSAIDAEIVSTLFRMGHATIEAKGLLERAGVTLAGAAKVMGGDEQSIALRDGENNIGRNDPCPCGSGKKYKKCHGK